MGAEKRTGKGPKRNLKTGTAELEQLYKIRTGSDTTKNKRKT